MKQNFGGKQDGHILWYCGTERMHIIKKMQDGVTAASTDFALD